MEVAKLAWGVNNSTLAAGLDNNKVVILEMPSGKVLRTLEREGLEGGIRYLAVLPDGRLVAASGNGAVSVWNSKWETVGDLFRLKKTVRQGGDLVRVEINVNDGTIPAGGTTIAFATSDGIVLWDADKRAVQRKVGTGPMYSVAWSVPLHRLIAAQEDRLAIYDEPSGELLASQVIWWGPGKHLFLSPEGHMRCSPTMSEDVVYVALTDDGRQITLRPAEFAAKYGWKNDPEKIRLSSTATADKPAVARFRNHRTLRPWGMPPRPPRSRRSDQTHRRHPQFEPKHLRRLQVKVTAPERVALGDHVTFDFAIKNAGSTTAPGLEVRLHFDPGLEHAVRPARSKGRSKTWSRETRLTRRSSSAIRTGKQCLDIEVTGTGGVRATATGCVTVVETPAAATPPRPGPPPGGKP